MWLFTEHFIRFFYRMKILIDASQSSTEKLFFSAPKRFLKSSSFQHSLFIFSMKGCFDWQWNCNKVFAIMVVYFQKLLFECCLNFVYCTVLWQCFKLHGEILISGPQLRWRLHGTLTRMQSELTANCLSYSFDAARAVAVTSPYRDLYFIY